MAQSERAVANQRATLGRMLGCVRTDHVSTLHEARVRLVFSADDAIVCSIILRCRVVAAVAHVDIGVGRADAAVVQGQGQGLHVDGE
jgi:hypothetical protein